MKKTERILIRVSEEDKVRIRSEAQAKRKSLSDFILRAALAVSPEAHTKTSRRKKA